METDSKPQEASPGSDAVQQHLSHLHRMSTTAGVTNQDYVAVNPLAVVAAVLGLMSGMAFFGMLLLVIPVIGIIFAVIAMRQVADSNGTQTGRGLAAAGLALCVLCAGGVAVRSYLEHAAVREDEQAIGQAIAELGRHVKERQYARAYGLFDDEFRDRISFDGFQQTWEAYQSPRSVGTLESLHWNGVRPAFESSQGDRVATTVAKGKFERSAEERYEVKLRKVGEKWLIAQLPQFFRAPQRSPRATDPYTLD